jgi:peptidoglycan/xylan/chitin deacetylase (PgdA/CDA1 family)
MDDETPDIGDGRDIGDGGDGRDAKRPDAPPGDDRATGDRLTDGRLREGRPMTNAERYLEEIRRARSLGTGEKSDLRQSEATGSDDPGRALAGDAVPETAAPEGGAPDTTAPQTAAPETAAPESGVAASGALVGSGPSSGDSVGGVRRIEAPRRGAPRRSERPARPSRSSRVVAISVLVVVAVILIVVGFSVAKGDQGGQKASATTGSVPFKILPDTGLPGLADQSTTASETTTQASESSTTESTGDTTATTGAGLDDGEDTATTQVLPASLPATAVKVKVPILMYHYVDSTPPTDAGQYAESLTVKTKDFQAEMKYLSDNHYQTVTLADVYLAMAGSKVLPAHPVVLTFDDGGSDNYAVAYPILKQYGLTATFFVITGSVGKPGQMDWDQLRDMVAGGMSVQSHTVTHKDLTTLSAADLKAELTDSRQQIEDQVGAAPFVLCYPSGAYDDTVMNATRVAGYVMAVTTDTGKEGDPKAAFEMKRRRVVPAMSISAFGQLLK